MLCLIYCYAEHRYAEHRYAEHRYAEHRYAVCRYVVSCAAYSAILQNTKDKR